MKKQYIRPAMQIYQLGLDGSILMNVSVGPTSAAGATKRNGIMPVGAMTTTPLPPRTKHPTAPNRTKHMAHCKKPNLQCAFFVS